MQPTGKAKKKGVRFDKNAGKRDQGIQECLVSKDLTWLNSFHYCGESLRLMTEERINLRATFELIGKR